MEDQLLYKEMQDGNKEAFTRLFRTYYAPLCLFAANYIHQPEVAEEMVQDTFFHLWVDREKRDIRSSVKAYLFASVRNACLNYLKHQKVKLRHSEAVKHEHRGREYDAGEDRRENELFEHIHRVVEELPEKRGKIFRMVKFQGKSYKQVAELLGISRKTVENQMGRALEFLRKELRDKLPLIFWIFTFFMGGMGVMLILVVILMK